MRKCKFNMPSLQGSPPIWKEDWHEGYFQAWGVNYEEFESGPGNYSVGIVQGKHGIVYMPRADNIIFLPADEDTITLTRKDYHSLLKDSQLLDALQSAGVDNWAGFDDAKSFLEEDTNEND